jgi:hypothetical protein
VADVHLHHEGYPSKTNAVVRIDESRIHVSAIATAPAVIIPFEVLEHIGDAALRPASQMLLSVGGRISHRSDPTGIAHGVMIPQQLVTTSERNLVVPMSTAQLELIDAERDPASFTLYLWLNALADMKQSFIPRENIDDRHLVTVSSGQNPTYVKIDAEHWLRLLAELGSDHRRLLELPSVALRNDTSNWAECTVELQAASLAWRRREYREVASKCRLVIEGLTTILGSQFAVARGEKGMEEWGKAIGNVLNNRWKDATGGDRSADGELLVSLMYAAFRWSSASHHFGGFAFDKRTASLSLALATDLYIFVAGLV